MGRDGQEKRKEEVIMEDEKGQQRVQGPVGLCSIIILSP
jgi:hypothetical protein